MEECADDTSSVEGYANTRVYATSEAPTAPMKPLPNSSKSRSNDRYRSSPRRGESSASNSDSTSHSSKRESKRDKDSRQKDYDREERRRKEEKREKDARRAKAAEERAAKDSSKALKKIRPPPRHATSLPMVQHGPKGSRDDPRAYGIAPPPPPQSSRPRASSRPASYYAGQQPPRPPPGWSPGGPGMPPAPFPVGTFPPPQMFPPGPPPGMHHMPLPSPSPSNAGSYLEGPPPPMMMHGRDLRHRFDPRPSSAMGFSPSQRSYLSEEFGFEDEQRPPHMGRRPSHTSHHDEDRKRMPPPGFIPARPRTTASPSTPFQPPPQRPASRHGHGHPQLRPKGANRRSIGMYERPEYDDEEDLFGAEDLFHDNSPEPAYGQRRAAAARSRHHIQYLDDDDDEDEDDDEEFDLPLHVTRVNRRGSIHTAALGSGGVSLERDRYLDAMRYQDDVNGGPQMPLTAETLRKASKRGDPASSRSTRSSDSRDESEYKRSATTGITRSSTGNPDDLTIKFSGAAVVRFEGAEIECDDGEITFSNRNGTTRVGSDRASTVYQLEDGRSRMERKALPHRPRAPSQSDAQSRFAPSHAPYEHAPYDPSLSYY